MECWKLNLVPIKYLKYNKTEEVTIKLTRTITNYKEYTIGELILSLKQAVETNSYISYDSPVFISDYNMSGFMHELGVAPTFSSKHHTAGLCIFHSLKNEFDDLEEVDVDEFGNEIEENTQNYIMKSEEEKEQAFMKFVRSIKQ